MRNVIDGRSRCSLGLWLISACSSIAMLLCAQMSFAETATVKIGYQYGLSYVVFHVMERQALLEKHAKASGLVVSAQYLNMSSSGVLRDSLLSGQVDYGALGPPSLIFLADKTNGAYKMAANIASFPMILNTTEDVKSICELRGKIAMSAVKSSVYAIALQMASKQQCHDPFLLDPNTVSMTNPDGMAALLNGQVASHFSAYPFVDLEQKLSNGRIKPILNSYDTMGGPAALIILVGKDNFREQNPQVYAAMVAALDEAIQWVKLHKVEAAKLYIEEEHSKEPLDTVIAQLSSPDVIYDITPRQISKFAHFMKEIGTAKRDWDWKALSSPNLLKLNGS